MPFQSAAGSNRSVPRSAAAIESSLLTAAGVLPDFKMPWAASGRVAILTDFSVWPSSAGSLKAPVKSAAENVSAVSSATVLVKSEAAGGSLTALTVMVTAAVAADSWSVESVTA